MAGVEFEELGVVDLDEGLVDDAIVVLEVEGGDEAELLVEGAGGVKVMHAEGDVSDAAERLSGLSAGSGLRKVRRQRRPGQRCEQQRRCG